MEMTSRHCFTSAEKLIWSEIDFSRQYLLYLQMWALIAAADSDVQAWKM